LDPSSNPDPKLITDPNPNLLIISYSAGSGWRTLKKGTAEIRGFYIGKYPFPSLDRGLSAGVKWGGGGAMKGEEKIWKKCLTKTKKGER
jgi:hypothetical protein